MASSEKDNSDPDDDPDAEQSENVAQDTPVATITLVALLILGAAVYGFASLTGGEAVERADPYNGYQFIRTDMGFYETTVSSAQGETPLEFRHHPSDVDNISVDRAVPRIIRTIQGRNGSLYLSITPAYSEGGRVALAGNQISRITNYLFGIETKGAVTRPSNVSDAPVITCDNVTSTQTVIVVDQRNTTGITQRDGCITLNARSETDVTRAADRLMYGLLGIIEA